jgi:hypothetical protein
MSGIPVTSTVSSTVTRRENINRLVLPTAAATTVVAAALSFVGRNDMGEWYFELGIQVVTAALVFGVVTPRGLRHESAGGRALVMAVIGLLVVVPAFWLGIPVQLGAAAALLGYAGRRAGTGSGKCMVALVLGILTVVAYVAINLGDYLHTH